MKNNKWFILAVLAVILFGSNNFAKSDIVAQKVAVVDIKTVVAKSPQVKTLKDEHVSRNKELAKWVEIANADVKKQSTNENKQKMLKKYTADLDKKKKAIAKDYDEKLSVIQKSISETIVEYAKTNGYALVLNKNAVVYGGDDITAAVSKIVK